MKTLKTSLALTIIIALLFPVIAWAAPGSQDDLPGEIDAKITEYIAALGLGFLVPFIIELLKRFRVIPDGYAGTAALMLNVVLYLILLSLDAFALDLQGTLAQRVIQVLASITNLLLMILSTFTSFNKMREAEVPLFQRRYR